MTQYYGARSRLAKMVLEKSENDENLSRVNRLEWYQLNTHLLPNYISSKYLQLWEDVDTCAFIENSKEKSNWLFTQLYHSFALTFLKFFMSTTSVNGLLQRGSMFVFSMAQFQALMEFDEIRLDKLLDLGAGDGAVTEKMAPFFNSVYTTEMSYTMQWRLSQKGYKNLDVNNWHQTIEGNDERYLKFDAISCLNLLDRCDKPLSLLKQIKGALKPNGYLIVALVLPFKPYVEYNTDNKPSEVLPFNSKTNSSCDRTSVVSEQITVLVDQVFKPLGFELSKFSRVPYLCEGNLAQSYYYLIDYLFVFKSV